MRLRYVRLSPNMPVLRTMTMVVQFELLDIRQQTEFQAVPGFSQQFT